MNQKLLQTVTVAAEMAEQHKTADGNPVPTLHCSYIWLQNVIFLVILEDQTEVLLVLLPSTGSASSILGTQTVHLSLPTTFISIIIIRISKHAYKRTIQTSLQR
jgi:hypothetical protein